MGLTRLRATNILDSDYKSSCRVTTLTNVTLAGGAPNSVDGQSLAVGNRVLVQGQSLPKENGIYRVTVVGTGSNGTWVRDTDGRAAGAITSGVMTYIEQGSTNGNKFYYCTTIGGNLVIDTDDINFTELTAAVAGAISIGGSNTSVVFNDAGTLGGSTYWRYNKTSGNLFSNTATPSTSTTTGALIVGNGVGIGGNLNVGGYANIASTVTVTGNVIPSANVTYNLGSSSLRWNNLWLAGSTLYLGSIALKDNNGTFSVYSSTSNDLINVQTASINNTPIGNATASTGAFTTLSSTSTTTVAGTLLATGGNIFVPGYTTGGGLTINKFGIYNEAVDQNQIFQNATNNLTNGGGLWISSGGLQVYSSAELTFSMGRTIRSQATPTGGTNATNQNIVFNAGGSVVINNNQVSTSTVTGALQVVGGVGIGGNLYVGGNLIVQGATTTVSSATLDVTDINITLAKGAPTTAATENAGITVDTANAQIFYNAANSRWQINKDVNFLANTYISGERLRSTKTTASTTPPGDSFPGDWWYNTSSDAIYLRINDGSANLWVDMSSTPGTFGNVTVTGNLSISGNLSSSVTPYINNSYNLGSASYKFATVYGNTFSGTATQAQYADLAEIYVADCALNSADVVIFGGLKEITKSYKSHDHRIAGVVSTKPAYLMNSESEGYAVALTGRVPCYVCGPVEKGDLLVSSDQPGVAVKLKQSSYVPGCVIGKSLENISTDEVKIIEIAVGRF